MNLRYFLLLALVVAAILIGKYCCMPKNALVEIKSRIQAPMGVAFIEVKDGARQNVSGKIKVTFIDSAGQVMSANGIPLKTFEVTQVMSIGLSPAAVFSPDKPYLFYIKAEADGYETNVKPVVVTQNVPNYVPIYMAKLDALPPGGGLASAVGTTSALIGSSQTIVAGTGAQQFKLTFAEGTTFIADKKRVNPESRLSYSLLRGINNPLDSIGNTFTNQAFPGGAEVVNARDASGNIIATPASPFYFTTAGWFTMDIKTAEGQKVDAFSKPADVEMPLSKNLKNPITNAPLKVGDRIPLWSMNERTGVWRQEGETIVADAGNGQLKTSFKVSHLSTWNMDFMNGGCPAGTVISVINNSGLTGTFFSQYINASDRSVLTQKMVSLSAGIQLDVIRPPNVPGRIYVHQGSDVNTRLAARSSVLNCSSINNTLDPIGVGNATCVEFHFQRVLDILQPDPMPESICGHPVWYKEGPCGDSNFWYQAGSTDNSGIVKVFSSGSSHECIELRYGTPEIKLTFPIDLGATQGSGTIGGCPYTYIISPGGSCGKIVQIKITHCIMTGPVCNPQ